LPPHRDRPGRSLTPTCPSSNLDSRTSELVVGGLGVPRRGYPVAETEPP